MKSFINDTLFISCLPLYLLKDLYCLKYSSFSFDFFQKSAAPSETSCRRRCPSLSISLSLSSSLPFLYLSVTHTHSLSPLFLTFPLSNNIKILDIDNGQLNIFDGLTLW